MKKISFLLLVSLTVILTGCGTTTPQAVNTVATGTLYDTGNIFTVGQPQTSDQQVYGLVVADNVKNIVTSVGGNLDTINCQPGDHVTASTIIAQIGAAQDVSATNSEVQSVSLQEQIQNMQKIIAMTDENFGIQEDILDKQKNNNAYLMDNLKQQKDINSNDMNLQVSSLQDQQSSLEDSQNTDADKMQTSIKNIRDQLNLSISDAFKKVDDVFGILSHAKNAAFDQYVSANDTNLRNLVTQQFQNLYTRFQNINDVSDDDFSHYLSQFSIMLKNAALSINASTPSSALPQTATVGLSIDALYTTYLGLATSFAASKSNYDTLLASVVSLDKNYDTQLNTLDTNMESLSQNKSQLSTISSDTQIANLTLAQQSIDDQIAALQDTKDIQLASLHNQLITLQQNEAILDNTLAGETLTAGVDGTVKVKSVGADNKVAPNTMICQIIPDGAANFKIQIYSFSQISIGQEVSFYRGDLLLGTGNIVYQLPYKDAATQNYIYEMVGVSLPVLDGEKVSVKFTAPVTDGILRIPLQYISPRLEGDLVRRKVGTGIQNVYVTLGNINDSSVQVLSGLNMGDEIVQ